MTSAEVKLTSAEVTRISTSGFQNIQWRPLLGALVANLSLSLSADPEVALYSPTYVTELGKLLAATPKMCVCVRVSMCVQCARACMQCRSTGTPKASKLLVCAHVVQA